MLDWWGTFLVYVQGKGIRMEQAHNVIIFWVVYFIAVVVYYECAHRLIIVNRKDDPEGLLMGAWH